MKKSTQVSTELDDADLDAASGGFAGASGTGKTLTSTLLGKYWTWDISDDDSTEPAKRIVASGGGNDI